MFPFYSKKKNHFSWEEVKEREFVQNLALLEVQGEENQTENSGL